MLSPFHHLSKPFEKKLTIFLLVLFVFSLIGMNISGGEFTNEVAPFGIVSFELGKTLANSQAILNSWNTETQLFAAFNTAGLDSLFLIVYSLFFALLLHKLAFRFWKDKNKNLFSLGIILSYLMLFNAFCCFARCC